MKNTALITGASSGLGKEFAIIHAQRGGDLVLVARRQDKLRELEKALSDEYDCKVMVIVKDLTAANAAQEIYEELNKFGVKPEYLINNAGFG
jgi:short-subunit dehydrogenase